MANRDDLVMIKAARTGAAAAQLALGSRYFFGGSGLPQSTETAFYWLERAARQNLRDAWIMIGRHVPYELVTTMSRPYEAAAWYETAFDAGVFTAGLVFARLVLEHARHFSLGVKKKALNTLRHMAEKDHHEAQWLLAQQMQSADVLPDQPIAQDEERWVQKAAQAGIEDAQYALLEKAWIRSDLSAYRHGAEAMVDRLLLQHRRNLASLDLDAPTIVTLDLHAQETRLLLRFAQLLTQPGAADLGRLQNVLELAAMAGDSEAGLALGLLHARIDDQGERTFPAHGLANYKKAIPWLLLAARNGQASAWHALSRIYAKSEFSQRDLPTAKKYLSRAAEAGLSIAQFEYAQQAWRNRRDDPMHDVHALYWWRKAAMQGHPEARDILDKFAVRLDRNAWHKHSSVQLTSTLKKAHPFLAARIELADAFGLTRPEALLIDVRKADHGHCLVVDIGAYHARSRRRLILIENEQQRLTLNLVGRLFGDVDCSHNGPEGNYRQRQYKLKTLLPDLAT